MHRWTSKLDLRPNPGFRLWVRICVFGICGLIGGFGCGSEEGQKVPLDEPGAVQPVGFERFSALQPQSGDTLVPPRLGFRWQFQDLSVARRSSDPEVQESAHDDVQFRLQILDASGAIHADHRTLLREHLVTLPPSSGPGRYIWWLEAYSRGDSSRVAESERHEFELRSSSIH